jgi:uncharacterized protein (TIGR00369 family)
MPPESTAARPASQSHSSPYIEHLGILFVRMEPDEVELHLPIRPEFMNTLGIVHGGICAGLADTALGTAIYARLGTDTMAMTVELSCRYLRAAREGTLRCLARVIHSGRSTVIAEADVYAGEKMIFKATGTFMRVNRA